jgi:hypothetical protein
MRVMEHTVLRKIFGPRKEGKTLGARNMHNEQLRDLYYPPYFIRVIELRMRWEGHRVCTGEKRKYKVEKTRRRETARKT